MKYTIGWKPVTSWTSFNDFISITIIYYANRSIIL